MWEIIFAFFIFMAGFIIGQWNCNRRWRENADEFHGMEYKGKVYKVLYQYHYDLMQERADRRKRK